MTERMYGDLTGHAVGIIMVDLARRAITTIRRHQNTAEVQRKIRDDGVEDFVTSADRAAQAVYLDVLRSRFPGFGIIAEEDDLRIPCTLPSPRMYFTVDPLDGTKAFIRYGTEGVGTMLALVVNDTVVASVVGDVYTQDIIVCAPDSDCTHHVSESGVVRTLAIDADRSLAEQCILLYETQDSSSAWIRDRIIGGGRFPNINVRSGSIGVSMVRLWRGAIGAIVLRANKQTPWDLAPIVCISERLGFVFLRPAERSGGRTGFLETFRPQISEESYYITHEALVVHRSRLGEINDILAM